MLNYQRVCGFAGKQATVPEDPLWWITMDHKLRAQPLAIGSMYAIYIYVYGNIYHQYTPNVSIYIYIIYIYIYHTWILWVVLKIIKYYVCTIIFYSLYPVIPSGNETWLWNIHHLVTDDFPSELNLHWVQGCPSHVWEQRRIPLLMIHAKQLSLEMLSIRGAGTCSWFLATHLDNLMPCDKIFQVDPSECKRKTNKSEIGLEPMMCQLHKL